METVKGRDIIVAFSLFPIFKIVDNRDSELLIVK